MPRNKFLVLEIRNCCECGDEFASKNWAKKTCSQECSRALRTKTHRRASAAYYRRIVADIELKASYLQRKRNTKQKSDHRKNYMRNYMKSRYYLQKIKILSQPH